jgi:GNAT superfamily N-acetyltransferase
MPAAEIRDAELPRDLDAVRALWSEYLTWGNDELESRYGFRFPVGATVADDLAAIGKFAPPDGRLLLAFDDQIAVAVACLRRIGPATAEIKRMYVRPTHRHAGIGRALLDAIVSTARAAGYERIRLDSAAFMSDAHDLYRSSGFVEIRPYPESEIPDERKRYWLFMERTLA